MSSLRVSASLLLGVAFVAAVLLALNFWPSSEPPLPDRGRKPLEAPPTLDEPPQPPVPLPDMSDAVPAATEAPAVDEAAEVPTEAPAAERPALPPLDESDAFIREQTIGTCAPLAWTAADNLARRASVVIENASRGELPPRRGGLLPPLAAFPVHREGERFFVDKAGYRRFDPYLDDLEAIRPDRLAGCLRLLGPLLDQALRELGYVDGPQSGIAAAIDGILAVPEPNWDAIMELVQPKVLFEYADPRLESLNALQKQVLRMGPDNVRRLKAYASRLRPLLAESP